MKVSFVNQVEIPIWNNRNSDSPAFCVGGVSYSYAQLFDIVEQIYDSIKNIDNQYVGLYGVDDIRTYAAILALWFQGKTYVPLSPMYPKDRQLKIISDVGVQCVLSADSTYSLEDDLEIVDISRYQSEGYQRKNTVSISDIPDSTDAYLVFTSGSTGSPKGVRISRGNVACFVDSMNQSEITITSQDRCLQPFDITFAGYLAIFILPLVKGACAFTIPNNVNKSLYVAGLLNDHKLTVLHLVPSLMRNLKPFLSEIDLSEVRYILCGSEPVIASDIIEWCKINSNMVFVCVYGQSENTVFSTGYFIHKDNIHNIAESNDIVSIGNPFPNTIIMLIDEDNNEITESNRFGALCISSDRLTSGYWNNNEENDKKFFVFNGKRYYNTGDLCYYNTDGNLMFVGRRDFQIEINGFRVESREVEYVYKQVSNGKFAIVVPYIFDNQRKLAIVIEGKQYDYTEHKALMTTKLPPYMIPQKWFFLQSFPLNNNGKINRLEIQKLINKM